FGVANLISSDTDVRLSLPSHQKAKVADIVVNARVACDPELLEQIVKKVLEHQARQIDAALEYRQLQSFRPGRPVPTHRYVTAKNS
ncbi:MAG TPA: cobalamin biosynthesis protein P47K, partial [Planctomycetaceae bacterium]|nr:cobalamin biosynthesis protein P47K [Planctomycetaceae bacterium]